MQIVQHYGGWTEGDLAVRMEAHRNGSGSKLMRTVSNAGIEWSVVRTWTGTRHEERRLKKQKNFPRMCPTCQAAKLAAKAQTSTDTSCTDVTTGVS